MKFLSYAQNFEDVIINRAFKGRDHGFYIDVGAAHPVGHSVTKNFYDRGWRGINIEPGTDAFQMMVEDRPRDVNLNVGLSNAPGELKFYEAPRSIGLSTFRSDWRDRWHEKDGCEFVEKTVQVMTLAQVCEQYANEPVDFLKIDVEGHEPEVLAGSDLQRWRPKVVCVEGPRHLYEAKLIEANYLHATADGVNHYFVPAEESHLIPILAAPVSLVLDNFELYEAFTDRLALHSTLQTLAEATARAQQLEAELAELRQSEQTAIQQVVEANARCRQLEEEITIVRVTSEAAIESTSHDLVELQAIRDEIEATLEETMYRLATLTERHERLRDQIAPLIELKRTLKKVDGVFGHPAHKLRMMSSKLRQKARSNSLH